MRDGMLVGGVRGSSRSRDAQGTTSRARVQTQVPLAGEKHRSLRGSTAQERQLQPHDRILLLAA